MTGARPSITPVVLCGGSGTRLWPLSRKSSPKQFAPLLGGESPFQDTVRRFRGDGFALPLIVTADPFRFIVAEQLDAVGAAARAILIEPEPRNTAPAVLAAALHLAEADPDAPMLVTPSDHAVADPEGFRAAIHAAADRLGDGIVLFGIAPDAPETGYGYIELGASADDGPLRPAVRFTEKPSPEDAAAMVASGRHLWNAGLVLLTPRACIAAFRAHAPDLVVAVAAAVSGRRPDLRFERLATEGWSALRDVSVDYAVLEHAVGLRAMPYAGRWSDLGGWQAVWGLSDADRDGVAAGARTTAIDCADVLLRSEDPGVEVVGIGLEDVAVVATADAVLVARKSRAQAVGEAVRHLRRAGVPQADRAARAHRPWGWYERLAEGGRFQVKRIHVNPGAALSLQSHHHRAEHWIVVEGTAKTTVDGVERLVSENESIYVPLGAVHRLENPGKLPMVLIEVQTGAYLEEDDIVRYEDVYARS